MKFLLNIFILTTLVSQNVQEFVQGNAITFTQFSEKNKGEFIVFPFKDFKIKSENEIKVQYAFSKRQNFYYEILEVNNNSHLEVEFNQEINLLKRGKSDLSINSTFVFNLNKQKKLSSPTYSYSDQSIKIIISDEGVYKLSYKYFTDNQIQISNLFTNRLKLFNKNKEVPIFIESGKNQFIDEDGEYILFYGEKNLNTSFIEREDIYEDPYDKNNVYYLIVSTDNQPGLRLFVKNGQNLEDDDDLIFSPQYYNANKHLEVNNLLGTKYIPRVEPEFSNKGFYHHRDFYFWGPTIKNDRFYSYNFSEINNVYLAQNDSVEMQVMMSGSAGSYNGAHQVELKISKGSKSFEYPNWRYSYKQKIDFRIPYSFLNEKGNTFEAKAFYDNDLLLMNWIKVKYKSKTVAEDNKLYFSAIKPDPHPITGLSYSTYEYTIPNFTSSSLFLMKKNQAIIKNFTVKKELDNTYTLIFQDEIENENAEFVALATTKFIEPKEIEYNKTLNNTSLKTLQSNAEMIIIAPNSYYDKAVEYAEYKSQSIKTIAVPLDAILNEFNDGLESPVAIKEFLRYAYENWSSENSLKYVLFLGDAIRNYKNGNDEDYIIPTFQFITAKFGYVTSDAFYGYLYHSEPYLVDFINNPIADLYIGRVPASTIAELDAYLSKIKEYDLSNTQEKNLFLGGNDYSDISGNRELYTGKRVFLSQVSRMNDTQYTESKYNLLKRASDDPFNSTNTVLQGTDDLIKIFNEGVNYISFLGHGAGAVWGDKNIMLQEDVKKLQNKNKYPLVSSFTCFIGAFDGGRTMGEELLLQRNVGAIGVLGSSGVSLLYNQYMLGYYVNEFVFQNKYSYGEALSLGKYKYYRKGGNYISDTDLFPTPEHSIHKTLLLMEFNYLGDPSIQIKFPEELEVETQSTITQNSNLTVNLKNANPNTYITNYIVHDQLGEVLYEKDTVLTISGDQQIQIKIDQLTNEDIFFVKGSLRSDNKVYNFGKRIIKDSYLNLKSANVVSTIDTNIVDLITNNDYRLKLVSSKKVSNMTATIKAYRYDQSRFDRYRLTFTSNDSINFYSQENFRIKKDISDIDISEIRAFTNSEIEFRNLSLQVIPTKYVISPISNTLKIDYSDNTNISVSVAYPLSFKDSLTVYGDYYRVENDSIYFLGKDTLFFSQINTNKVSKLSLLENYNSQYAKYRISFYTDDQTLELDSVSQTVESDWTTIPNNLIYSDRPNDLDIILNDSINVSINLNESNFLSSNMNSILKVEMSQSNSTLTNPYLNILGDKSFKINYYNRDTKFQNLDTNNFKVRIPKAIWESNSSDKITMLYFDKEINNWLDIQSIIQVNNDSSLTIKSMNMFSKSGEYALVLYDNIDKFQVDINFEIDGIKSDSIQFTSISPKIKINLLSQSPNYVINPDNIELKIRRNSEIETSLPFSFSYSGINKNNLNVIIDGNSSLNEDGNYNIELKLNGYNQLYRIANGDRELILNNRVSQKLTISGNDNLVVYGNYPNPFGRKTIFPILLSSSDPSNLNLEIKIYNLSGLLVKKINQSNMLFANTANNASLYDTDITGDIKIGINYISWDGFSKNGEELANGIYFAKVIYKTNNKTLEKIIKIAKLKGYN